MIEKFGKPSKHILSLKKDFFKDNDYFLEAGKRINKVYISQPKRLLCKNCKHVIGPEDFVKLDVPYSICKKCGHLNGMHEDTKEFCSTLYTDDGGDSYSKNYNESDIKSYRDRVKNIYLPKSDFLCDSLVKIGENSSDLSYIDFGAGSGYFVNALIESGVNDVVGYDVSDAQVDFGNKMMCKKYLRAHKLEDTLKIIKTTKRQVVSMIGVLEHVQNPYDTIREINNNKNIKYLYISVPLFSPCVFFEMTFPHVMQRQLTSGHTHLYTKSSLEWISEKFNMKQVASWWFGTDMVDLLRNIGVSLEKQKNLGGMSHLWFDTFTPLIDDMQSVIDKHKLSSEVHMLFKLNN